MVQSLEQQIRDILGRMDIEGAQEFTSGDLVELANLLHDKIALEKRCEEAERERSYWRDRFESAVRNREADNALLRKRLERFEIFAQFILEECDDWKMAHDAAKKCMALKDSPPESNGK